MRFWRRNSWIWSDALCLATARTLDFDRSKIPSECVNGSCVSGLAVKALSAGDLHTCALNALAELYCWGANVDGQLGYSGPNAGVPTRVLDQGPWRSAAGGFSDTFAIKEDGSLWSWGYNVDGQLGLDGLGEGPRVPTLASAATAKSEEWVSVAPGMGFACGVRGNGSLWCWGWTAKTGIDTPESHLLVPTRVDAGTTC